MQTLLRAEGVYRFGYGDLFEIIRTWTYIYDAAGNLTGYDDGTTSAAYGYAATSRKIAEAVDFKPFAKDIPKKSSMK